MEGMGSSVLYVCATPIGHLADCSFRLIETLGAVDRIAAEDTRYTQRLLKRYGVVKPLISLEKFNELSRIDTIVSWLRQGESVALVSDAGTPTVSDPGFLLVRAVREAGFSVVPIPGPSAVVTLLSVAGLKSDSFVFTGFMPRKRGELVLWYSRFSSLQMPIVFYESPKRLLKHLIWLEAIDPKAFLVLGKEMTKQYESFFMGEIGEVVSQLRDYELLKGEWSGVVVPSVDLADGLSSLTADIQVCREAGLTDVQTRAILTSLCDYSGNVVKKALWS